jgi:hypothetical protein
MYTIGSTALKTIASRLSPADARAIALTGKIVGYVGTQMDRTGDGTPLHVRTANSVNSVFFQVPAVGTTGNDQYTIKYPIDSAQLYQPADAPSFWASVPPALTDPALLPILAPAGGIGQAVYAFQRGMYADMPSAFKIDGVPFYARDLNNEALYIYDAYQQKHIRLAYAHTVPIGAMFGWPFDLPNIPIGFVRADGSQKLISGTYNALYQVYGTHFNGNILPDPGYFRLPYYDNMIIRYID